MFLQAKWIKWASIMVVFTAAVLTLLGFQKKPYAFYQPIKLSRSENLSSKVQFIATVTQQDKYDLHLILWPKGVDERLAITKYNGNEFRHTVKISIQDENKVFILKEASYQTYLHFYNPNSNKIGIGLSRPSFNLQPGTYVVTVELEGNYAFLPESLASDILLAKYHSGK